MIKIALVQLCNYFEFTIIDDTQDKEAPQGSDEDQPMESGEEDDRGDAKEGTLNTKRRKADAKRRIKDMNQPSTMEHDGNDDYDFKIDYVKESAMETGDEVEANEVNDNKLDLPSRVELDKE